MMKEFIYTVYAFFFNFYARLFKVKKNRVALVSMHHENFKDALGGIYEELKKDEKYDFVFISKDELEVKFSNIPKVVSFFLVKSKKLATSNYIYLNDNFLPLSKLNVKEETCVVQLWHAEGVFKKFGFAINQNEKVRRFEKEANKKTDYVICSSKAVVPFYAEAFLQKKEKVFPLGSARTDYFFKEGNKEIAKKHLEKIYPKIKGKKILLYAPTFRDTKEENENILKQFDAKTVSEALGEEYIILVKLHPQINTGTKSTDYALDVTNFDDVRELILASDVLVTDYSSICMDFSLLSKKTVFFAYDLSEYTAQRNFYFDYESYIPGKIALTPLEIAKEVKAPFDKEKNDRFKKFNFDFEDAYGAKRIVDFIHNKRDCKA